MSYEVKLAGFSNPLLNDIPFFSGLTRQSDVVTVRRGGSSLNASMVRRVKRSDMSIDRHELKPTSY